MAVACPRCEESAQVRPLPVYWASLAPGAELKQSLAQPPRYQAQWLVPAGVAAAGALAIASGGIVLGVLSLGAGSGLGGWMYTRVSSADAARERWQRLLYCARCTGRFLPEEAMSK